MHVINQHAVVLYHAFWVRYFYHAHAQENITKNMDQTYISLVFTDNVSKALSFDSLVLVWFLSDWLLVITEGLWEKLYMCIYIYIYRLKMQNLMPLQLS